MTSVACLAAVGLLTAGLAGSAAAQNFNRCGPDGRSYSQQPCADGRLVPVDDARGTASRREGEAAAARQARAAKLLVQERERREAARPRAASLGHSASGDPSFAPSATATKGASSKASRKGSARKDKRRGDAPGKAGASAAPAAEASR